MPQVTTPLTVDDQLWEAAVQREAVLRSLAQIKVLTAGVIDDSCRKLGIRPSNLYRLLKLYKKNPRASALLPKKSGRAPGTSGLVATVDQIIQTAIREYYLSRQKPNISKLCRTISMESHGAGVPCPSRKAIENRVKSLDPRVLLAEREGPKIANDKCRPVPGELRADHPLQIVQVDHTKVDVFVVDEKHHLPIQRPWLTLLIDVATRMVAGYYLSLEAPSSTSVALALQQAVLPKDDWLAARGISAPWPVQGIPELLHMDNAKEFHAKALRRGAEEYGITLFYRPIATPHYGGHIERLIGTMMGEVHLLPGTTFSNIKQRGDYKPEDVAVMTLRDLDQWLAIEITGKYHQCIHRSLARPPIAVWEEMAAHAETVIRHPQDNAHFFCDFLPSVERKIGREGISFDGIKYWDSVLSIWAGNLDRKVTIRYDPRDLSAIYVQSPDGSYWKVRYRNLGNPSITRWEHKAARHSLREQGRREFNEQVLFDAIAAQRMLVAEASAKTKRARRDRQRTREALDSSVPRSDVKPLESGKPIIPTGPVLPYEIEDWS